MRPFAALAASLCLLLAAGCSGGDLGLPEDTSPAGMEAVGGNGQMALVGAELPLPLVVRVTDVQGRPVPGVSVAFQLGAGAEGGETSPDTAVTDDEGEASARWVLGDAEGQQRVDAEVVDAGLAVVSFTATAVKSPGNEPPEPSPGHSSVAAQPTRIEAITGLAVITVTVRDGRGDPFPGATVTLTATGPGNELTQPSAPTGPDGVATGTLQSIVPGSKVVSAVVNGGVAIEETAEVTVTATPEPERLAFVVEPSNVEEDEVISPPVSVAVVDAAGDVVPVSGVEIELELLRDGKPHDIEGDLTQSTVDGIAVFPDLLVDHEHDEYRLRATAPGRPELGSVESSSFDVED